MSRCHCIAKKKVLQCDLINDGVKNECCWCGDERHDSQRNNPKIYIDGIGEVFPGDYGLRWPVDCGYCPKCRHSRISTAELYNNLRKTIAYRNAFK